jgi:hypothetical protein
MSTDTLAAVPASVQAAVRRRMSQRLGWRAGGIATESTPRGVNYVVQVVDATGRQVDVLTVPARSNARVN